MSAAPATTRARAAGPLVVSDRNPRYFTVGGGDTARAVYLTGSHIWNNFHDGMGPGPTCADAPEPFDYDAYLAFLKERGHNFIRLWRWEQVQSQAAGGGYHLCMTPQPWARTGPGTAKDGKPKFNLDALDQAYFDRLRERVIRAGEEGIYVDVMFFDGWALHLSPAPDNVEGHPFHAGNNVNDIGITSIADCQVLPLDPRVEAFEAAYIRKVVDTVQDLPNVLYEVANESVGGGSVDQGFAQMLGLGEPPMWGDSTDWQYWVIDTVKSHEQEQGYVRHPIGMTMQFPVPDQTRVNEPLYRSRAEWISPGFEEKDFNPGDPASPRSRWLVDPPVNDARKVVICDTDHFAPGGGDALWAWKSFLRGHHTILMDFGIIAGVNPPDPAAGGPGVPPFAVYEPARYAMGDTRRFAEAMNLIGMEPRDDLSSTGYALANPSDEYRCLQPSEGGAEFSVRLEAGRYAVDWFSVNQREDAPGETITVAKAGGQSFTSPFGEAGPVMLHLKRAGS